MRTDVAAAAVEVAHEHGVLVFAHTSDRTGLQVALDAGVDVVAHVPDETEGVAPLLRRAAESGVVLVPTFQMFARTVTDSPTYLDPILEAAQVFTDAGGRLMFGTDVGYMDDPTIDDELGYLARCGLDGTRSSACARRPRPICSASPAVGSGSGSRRSHRPAGRPAHGPDSVRPGADDDPRRRRALERRD